MLKRNDWRALQGKPAAASKPIQLKFAFVKTAVRYDRSELPKR
jgi:hypothetical protein